ncbi:hypothetical protein TorRG33x02_032580 [Trema orientale]|uniref:Transposase, Ptta/En/Spm, plant n=1 Tax=Trema orientale TaxID=63057 RepID=A0A2P5FTF5_TREOI|nr:hypothetical protein TorRG33x02_032580 [Trema orientale]
MRRTWRGQKYKLYTYFKEIGGEQDPTKAKSLRHEEGRVLDDRTGQIETWRTMHFNPEIGWTGPDLQDLYDCMLELRSQNTPEDMSDKDILEHVLGCHSVRLKGWARSPTIDTQTDIPDSTNGRPTYTELCAELTAMKNRLHEVEGSLDECRQVLRGQGYMPPPSSGLVSDQSSGPAS